MSDLGDAVRQFEASGLDYLPLADHSPQHGHLLFRGPFLGHEVLWDCHIVPLLAPEQSAKQTGNQQFIDIPQQKNNNCQHIDIGLNVINISDAVILKTMIMVRQYKNLAYGRHQWK